MRVVPRAVAATLTVLLHLLVLAALLRATTRAVKPPEPPAGQETSAAKLYDAGEQIVSVDIRPGLAKSGFVCGGSSYVGVGVTVDPGTERIILVGDNTPASRAGLQHDDIVLNPEVWRDAHREGVVLRVTILREGVRMIVRVRVGEICIE
jgi:predicted metalloprotease with PDZ domain